MTPSPLRRAAMMATSAALCLALGACGADSIAIPTGDGGSVKVDKGNDGFSVETDEGSARASSSNALPDGYPEEDVPVVPGTIISSFSVDSAEQKGWSVVIQGSASQKPDTAVDLLTAKGFTVESTFASDGSRTTALDSTNWQVIVSVAGSGADQTFSYTVAATAAD